MATTIERKPMKGDVFEGKDHVGRWHGRVLRKKADVAWARMRMTIPGHRLLRGGLIILEG